MRPFVFVSGPYSGGDPVENVKKAIAAGEEIIEMGGEVYIPHLCHLWNELSPHKYEYWMTRGLWWVRKSDFLFRIRGESPGADREEALAIELGIPVFDDIRMLRVYVEDWNKRELESGEARIVMVEKCQQCPHRQYDWFRGWYTCMLEDKSVDTWTVKYAGHFPVWCPLKKR